MEEKGLSGALEDALLWLGSQLLQESDSSTHGLDIHGTVLHLCGLFFLYKSGLEELQLPH